MKNKSKLSKALFWMVIIVCGYLERNVYARWFAHFVVWFKTEHGSVADWFSAIGTIGAVVVAIFFNILSGYRAAIERISDDVSRLLRNSNMRSKQLRVIAKNIDSCVKFMNQPHTIYMKKEKLKSMLPTLKQARKLTIYQPSTQYLFYRVIKNIEQDEIEIKFDMILEDLCIAGKGFVKYADEQFDQIGKETSDLQQKVEELEKSMSKFKL